MMLRACVSVALLVVLLVATTDATLAKLKTLKALKLAKKTSPLHIYGQAAPAPIFVKASPPAPVFVRAQVGAPAPIHVRQAQCNAPAVTSYVTVTQKVVEPVTVNQCRANVQTRFVHQPVTTTQYITEQQVVRHHVTNTQVVTETQHQLRHVTNTQYVTTTQAQVRFQPVTNYVTTTVTAPPQIKIVTEEVVRNQPQVVTQLVTTTAIKYEYVVQSDTHESSQHRSGDIRCANQSGSTKTVHVTSFVTQTEQGRCGAATHTETKYKVVTTTRGW
ncbi:uncharacterized protein LOC135103316 [Scylla paramamosain]|uniref:uncharacterized protein LOC135103316 n=1 Tax=Scylla paramamosain TaxID=85552 RepID=UPI0030835C01